MQRTTIAFRERDANAARPWWQLGLTAAAVAAILNAAVFSGYRLVTGAPLRVPPLTGEPGTEPLSIVMVIVSSMIPVLFATLLAAGLNRWPRSGRTWFIGLSAVAALLSLNSPFSLAETSLANNATLAAMHLIAGAVTIVLLAPRFEIGRA